MFSLQRMDDHHIVDTDSDTPIQRIDLVTRHNRYFEKWIENCWALLNFIVWTNKKKTEILKKQH